jgi:hypothetical protein
MIKLEFDERVFSLLSKDLYKDKLSFVRELIQNSYDAKASKIVIEIDRERKTITFTDDGNGMSYLFMKYDFRRIGKAFKAHKDNQIGFYGIGRLSVWLVANKVEIRSLNGLLIWDNISSYSVQETKEIFNGCRITLHVKDEDIERVLDGYHIKWFIENNIILPLNIEIIDKEYSSTFRPKSMKSSFPYSVYLPKYKVKVYVRAPESWSDILIFEKGLLVTKSYSDKLYCILDFNIPVKTLSRESLTINQEEIDTIILEAYKILSKKHKFRKEIRESISYLASKHEDKELASMVLLDNVSLIWYKERGYYYSSPTALVSRARSQGYNVVVTMDKHILKCCEILGIVSLLDIKDQLRDEIVHLKAKSEKGKKVLEASSRFLDRLVILTDKISKQPINESEGKVISDSSVAEIKEKIKSFEDNAIVEVNIKNEEGHDEIKFLYGNVGFGYHEDDKIAAWRIRDKIALNLNNELVQTALDTGRWDILEETLTHEYVHLLGYHFHDSKFTAVYSLLRHQVLIERAKSTCVTSTKASSIPPEARHELSLKEDDNVILTIEPVS